MSSTAIERTTIAPGVDPTVPARVIEEGYGPGAWHGPDLRAALADLSPHAAFWRPGAGRHDIAEIALHHAGQVQLIKVLAAAPCHSPGIGCPAASTR